MTLDLRRLGLQAQLTLVAVALIVVTTTTTAYLTISSALDDTRERARSSALVLSNAVSRSVEYGLSTSNPAEIAKAVAFLRETNIVTAVEIRNRNGVSIYRETFGDVKPYDMARISASLDDISLMPFSHQRLFVIATPVDSSASPGRVLGTVETIVDFGSYQDNVRNTLFATVLSSLIVIALACTLAYWTSGHFLKPVRDVLGGLNHVAEGNFSHRLTTTGSRELQQLINGFNSMVDGLMHYRRETLRAREVLEQRVTERTHQLYEEKERAEQANRTKSEFLARMSHEIRTPMNGVLGMTELLLSGELPDSERHYARTIQQSGEALLSIINDILDFSKIEAGRMVLSPEQFELREMAEGVAEILAGNAHKKGLEFTLSMAPSLQAVVMGDVGRLRQVLVNLLGNAIKFTESGHINLSVEQLDEPATTSRARRFRFAVEDSGVGIATHKQATIFESFMQEDGSTTRRFGGTGLGLTISKQLVELMGGDLDVESAPGEGSTFFFVIELPLVEGTSVSTPLVQLSDQRVAVVSPDHHGATMIAAHIEHWGGRATVMPNQDAALALIDNTARDPAERPALVIFDGVNHQNNHLDFAVQVGRLLPAAERPTMILLTSTQELNATAATGAGYAGFLRKPVLQQSLARTLSDALCNTQMDSSVVLPDAAAPAREAPTPELKEPANTQRGKLLVVEDNVVNQRVCGAMLSKLGYKFDVAENGAIALECAQEHRYDLILMDCQMPVMDGFTATAWIRDRERDKDLEPTPIIALTANALQGDAQRCFDAGMDDYVSKPFTLEQLQAMLEKWLAQLEYQRSAANQ